MWRIRQSIRISGDTITPMLIYAPCGHLFVVFCLYIQSVVKRFPPLRREMVALPVCDDLAFFPKAIWGQSSSLGTSHSYSASGSYSAQCSLLILIHSTQALQITRLIMRKSRHLIAGFSIMTAKITTNTLDGHIIFPLFTPHLSFHNPKIMIYNRFPPSLLS